MRDNIKNITIGSMVVGAFILLTWILLFLHPSFGDGKFKIHARFDDIEKISVGSRVAYAGKPVGKVTHIDLLDEEERKVSTTPLYLYDVLLAIDSHVKVYDCDEITLGTSGLMGERFISIVPKRPKKKPATLLAQNAIVFALPAFSAEDTFTQVNAAAEKAEKTIEILADVLEQNQQNIQDTLKSFKSAASELDTFLQSANDSKLIQNFAQVVQNLSSGEGSFGKFVAHDDFYFMTVALMNKFDFLMNDINQYGILFHLDKAWQREQKRRVEEVSGLNSPEEFKAFLNTEMDKVNTAMRKLSLAYEKSSDKPEFKKSYRALLAQLDSLQGTLKAKGAQFDTAEEIADN